jgi:endonuclease/exonuclease/phosphatase family metal-dependent hydrolase
LAEQEIISHSVASSLAASNASHIHPETSGLEVCPFQKGEGAGAWAATYCGRTNKHVKNNSIQSRLDRIYVKIKRNSLKVHFYGLTGTFTQPSDHFGVFAQLEF